MVVFWRLLLTYHVFPDSWLMSCTLKQNRLDNYTDDEFEQKIRLLKKLGGMSLFFLNSFSPVHKEVTAGLFRAHDRQQHKMVLALWHVLPLHREILTEMEHITRRRYIMHHQPGANAKFFNPQTASSYIFSSNGKSTQFLMKSLVLHT